jgi:hypothetical protein
MQCLWREEKERGSRGSNKEGVKEGGMEQNDEKGAEGGRGEEEVQG